MRATVSASEVDESPVEHVNVSWCTLNCAKPFIVSHSYETKVAVRHGNSISNLSKLTEMFSNVVYVRGLRDASQKKLARLGRVAAVDSTSRWRPYRRRTVSHFVMAHVRMESRVACVGDYLT
mmetsp:Transcript_25723/g.37979  ORF Transcript_25723/g.37979 Transcript_25723/m.37979 type:complete len:122 (-) Transcript_25723:1036-1401(-)